MKSEETPCVQRVGFYMPWTLEFNSYLPVLSEPISSGYLYTIGGRDG